MVTNDAVLLQEGARYGSTGILISKVNGNGHVTHVQFHHLTQGLSLWALSGRSAMYVPADELLQRGRLAG
jgi:hypothetical protein